MQPQATPFQTGWWSFDLGKHRPCDGTYCYYDYSSIPPLDSSLFDGTFAWLEPLENGNPGALDAPTLDTPVTKKLTKLKVSAQKHSITLPTPFLTLMQNTTLQDSIPSCTACYFDLSKEVIPDPLQDKHYYIRFLNDQQDVLMWYLYLKADGDSCVVVSPVPLDEIEEEEIPAGAIKGNTFYCAESFEVFIYRFWLENTIWFALDSSEEMTETQKAYLAHYQKP